MGGGVGIYGVFDEIIGNILIGELGVEIGSIVVYLLLWRMRVVIGDIVAVIV